MKKCCSCKNEFNESNFYKDRTKKDGLSNDCKQCNSKKAKRYRSRSNTHKLCTDRWRKNNRDKVMQHHKDLYNKVKQFKDEYLRRNPCDCGESDICCLDFHHIKGKDKPVTNIYTFNKSIIEMMKCITQCVNCHRKIHAGTKAVTKNPPKRKELENLIFELFPDIKIESFDENAKK